MDVDMGVDAGTGVGAVLFDMDGTLVDSEGVWTVALHEVAAAFGGRLSDEARRSMVGMGTRDSIAILHADLGQPWRDPAASGALVEARVADLFAAGLQWRPGARRLLRSVRAAGIPTALVTSSTRRLVRVAMGTLGAENFDVVLCGDEVAAPKPDPTPYRMAADLLGVPPGRCVAVEDSPIGVASARAAGVPVLAVPHAVAVAPLDGVRVLPSLDGVGPDLLADLLAELAAQLPPDPHLPAELPG